MSYRLAAAGSKTRGLLGTTDSSIADSRAMEAMAKAIEKTGRGRNRPTAGSALLTLCLYALVYVFMPVALVTISHANPVRCNCSMCNIDEDGAHHCPCCKGGEPCKCAMSIPEDTLVPAAIRDVALLTVRDRFEIVLLSGYLIPLSRAAFPCPDLAVETPPPRA